jgi:ankyrin repeat protein
LNAPEGSTLFHLALQKEPNITDTKAIVYHLYNLYPVSIHKKNDSRQTPLHYSLLHKNKLEIEYVNILCDKDKSVVRDKCTPPHTTIQTAFLIAYKSSMMEVSDEGDSFRLFLHLFPASAGIKDGHSRRPYDLAVSNGLSVYFIRLLLDAVPTMDPVQRHNVNYSARREGMFLAFRALCSSSNPTIWAKLRHEDIEYLDA